MSIVQAKWMAFVGYHGWAVEADQWILLKFGSNFSLIQKQSTPSLLLDRMRG